MYKKKTCVIKMKNQLKNDYGLVEKKTTIKDLKTTIV